LGILNKKKYMAKKKSTKKRAKRRSAEQIIADLQEEIRRVRQRQRARELKGSPSHKAAMLALKAIDKALKVAAEHEETSLRHCLADSRKSLAAYLEKQGLNLPKANLPKGPRPKE